MAQRLEEMADLLVNPLKIVDVRTDPKDGLVMLEVEDGHFFLLPRFTRASADNIRVGYKARLNKNGVDVFDENGNHLNTYGK